MPFIFVGTIESITNATVLLEYNLEHLKDVEKLRLEKMEMEIKLRQAYNPTHFGGRDRR